MVARSNYGGEEEPAAEAGTHERKAAAPVILIVVKFKTKPEWTEKWLDLVDGFTTATRAEPGNLWFDWSRSVEDSEEFVLVEAFKDGAAEAHVGSEHFQQAMKDMLPALAETPHIINTNVDGEDWARMGELQVD